jgi:cyclopropane fatty-acyl-phospholipid synthase-like methyltransferase
MSPRPSPAADLPALYERHAAAFVARRSRALAERAWLERFRAAVVGERVLDLGCGFGAPIAAFLIEAGLRVTGIDAAPSLIALCRQRFPHHRWELGDMRSLELRESFGGLVAWDSLFHLGQDDQRRMFPAFARLAQPGAALLFNTGTQAGESLGEFEGEPLYHASLDAAEYRALLQSHAFSLVQNTVDDPTCGGRTVWLARKDDP